MSYLGDIDTSQILYDKFCTTAASTGAPTTLSGSPAISVYKDDNDTQSTSGITLTVDADSVTGMNKWKIDTSSDGTFYAAGHDFQVVITTGTVGGTSAVGYVVASFSIQNRSPLRPTTAGRKLDVSAGGEAGVDWANVGSPTTANALTATTISTSQVVASVTADVGITQAAADKVFGAGGAAIVELAGVPSATPNAGAAIMLPFMELRNKLTTDATTKTVFNNAGSAIGSKALSDSGTVYTEAKMA